MNLENNVEHLQLYSFLALGSGFSGLAVSSWTISQEAILNDNTLIPVSVAIGLLLTAMWATHKVTRLFDKFSHSLADMNKRINRVEKTTGSFEEEEEDE